MRVELKVFDNEAIILSISSSILQSVTVVVGTVLP